jgi:predicted HicB family RNase H-like nuclease
MMPELHWATAVQARLSNQSLNSWLGAVLVDTVNGTHGLRQTAS